MGKLELASIFSNNMILQRGKEIRIFGSGEDFKPVTVSINNVSKTVYPEGGKWVAALPPMEPAISCELKVSTENSEITIYNVAIGEVWIAGGQSNMEFALKYDAEAKDSIPSVKNPDIRFFDCPKKSYAGQENIKDMSEYGFWRCCDPENAPYYSAVGFYFAQKIYESQKVPVGIIGCNWGGTTASAWLDEKYLAADKDLEIYLREYEEIIKNLDLNEYENKISQQEAFFDSAQFKAMSEAMLAGSPSAQIEEESSNADLFTIMGPKSFNRPSGLYHFMVEEIAGYSARGVIWYQGESDVVKAALYNKLFSSVIQCWRDAWKDELPFLFVQLAPFKKWLMATGDLFPVIREQQEFVSRTVPKVYMASIMDSGMEFDIHPKRKRPVGERLSLLARNKVYGEDIISEAPEVDRATYQQGRIIINFVNAGNEIFLEGNKINGLQVFVNEVEIHDFNSGVRKDSIYIESDKFNYIGIIQVKFAWMPYVEVNLYSSAGLPVKPFKISLVV